MKRFEKRAAAIGLTRSEALACIPEKSRQVKETILEDGNVLLDYTVTVRPWFSGLLKRMGVGADGRIAKKLQLDELGTQVWALVDNRKTVREIVRDFALSHQLMEKEAEVAVTRFVRELGKRGLIGLR
ncbi:MAG: hypothetical protein AMJ54_08065 [Deltaproteobacteria bacterium SG8_13]|nr:MAG: hypothetical protein AMJ54_08065 [Deltaproteobacteria bacterium SG8_13]